jgi:hypothetical protein
MEEMFSYPLVALVMALKLERLNLSVSGSLISLGFGGSSIATVFL